MELGCPAVTNLVFAILIALFIVAGLLIAALVFLERQLRELGQGVLTSLLV